MDRSIQFLRMPENSTAVRLFVGLGIFLRFWHFFRFPSVWHDEAVVLINAMHLDFDQMWGPLIYHEAAPPLFLMAERASSLLFGDSVTAFRWLPLLASIAALVFVALIAWRVLPPGAAVWAIALFATSDRLLYHAVEAKPYSLDVAIAAAVAYGFVRLGHWPLWKQFMTALPVFPALIWVSFPACFVTGGWFAGLLPALLRSRCRGDWLAAFALAACVAASFLALALGPVAAQHDSSMASCWTAGFPNWERPVYVPLWLIRSTLDICCYCVSPQGWALAGMVAIGAVVLQRTDRRLLIVLATPLGLALVASLLGKYPYCGARVLAFMTPAICLLTALGIAPFIAWLGRQSRVLVCIGWMALALPFIHAAWRVADPWPRADTKCSADYVRSHWQPGDLVGFNNWESEYYFRDIPWAWMKSNPPESQSPRLWYVCAAPDPAVRQEVLNAVSPEWQPVERREFHGASVVRFARCPRGVASTSEAGLIP